MKFVVINFIDQERRVFYMDCNNEEHSNVGGYYVHESTPKLPETIWIHENPSRSIRVHENE